MLITILKTLPIDLNRQSIKKQLIISDKVFYSPIREQYEFDSTPLWTFTNYWRAILNTLLCLFYVY